MTLACPDCGSEMRLRQSRYGTFYGCIRYPDCKAAHGAHADGRPLGIPANKETKEWRIKAHAAFDQLWKTGGMKRKAAYRWMRDAMELSADEAHIGRFDIAACRKLITLVELHFSR